MNRSGIWKTVTACIAIMVCVLGLFLNRFFHEPQLTRSDLLQSGVVVFERPRDAALSGLFVTPDGESLSSSTFAGKWHFVFFGFTRCPDICPTTLAEMVRQRRSLNGGLGEDIGLMFVSLDTERDGGEDVERYLNYFDPELKGVYGGFGEISDFAASLNAAFGIVPTDDGYTIDHTGSIFIIGPEGRYRGFLKDVKNFGLAVQFLVQ
jgi:protein SCO1/2